MPKKISLKDFGMEKIILIAIAGIVLLAANFSEWKNSSSKTSEKQEKSIETSQNDAYVEALENKLVPKPSLFPSIVTPIAANVVGKLSNVV